MENYQKENGSKLTVENRKKLSLTGVTDVDRFDEDGMVIVTVMGTLNISGSQLHINKFNMDSSELVIEGEIDKLEYKDSYGSKSEGGLLAKIFK